MPLSWDLCLFAGTWLNVEESGGIHYAGKNQGVVGLFGWLVDTNQMLVSSLAISAQTPPQLPSEVSPPPLPSPQTHLWLLHLHV